MICQFALPFVYTVIIEVNFDNVKNHLRGRVFRGIWCITHDRYQWYLVGIVVSYTPTGAGNKLKGQTWCDWCDHVWYCLIKAMASVIFWSCKSLDIWRSSCCASPVSWCSCCQFHPLALGMIEKTTWKSMFKIRASPRFHHFPYCPNIQRQIWCHESWVICHDVLWLPPWEQIGHLDVWADMFAWTCCLGQMLRFEDDNARDMKRPYRKHIQRIVAGLEMGHLSLGQDWKNLENTSICRWCFYLPQSLFCKFICWIMSPRGNDVKQEYNNELVSECLAKNRRISWANWMKLRAKGRKKAHIYVWNRFLQNFDVWCLCCITSYDHNCANR